MADTQTWGGTQERRIALKKEVECCRPLAERPQPTRPERRARTAAWVRSSAHSLFKILRTWVLTVPTVMYSLSAIAALLHPSTISCKTSNSRSVKGSASISLLYSDSVALIVTVFSVAAVSAPLSADLVFFRTILAIAGSIQALPSWVTCIASSKLSKLIFFMQYESAPAAKAAITDSSLSCKVNTRILVGGLSSSLLASL